LALSALVVGTTLAARADDRAAQEAQIGRQVYAGTHSPAPAKRE
jgi:hypothetical protein